MSANLTDDCIEPEMIERPERDLSMLFLFGKWAQMHPEAAKETLEELATEVKIHHEVRKKIEIESEASRNLIMKCDERIEYNQSLILFLKSASFEEIKLFLQKNYSIKLKNHTHATLKILVETEIIPILEQNIQHYTTIKIFAKQVFVEHSLNTLTVLESYVDKTLAIKEIQADTSRISKKTHYDIGEEEHLKEILKNVQNFLPFLKDFRALMKDCYNVAKRDMLGLIKLIKKRESTYIELCKLVGKNEAKKLLQSFPIYTKEKVNFQIKVMELFKHPEQIKYPFLLFHDAKELGMGVDRLEQTVEPAVKEYTDLIESVKAKQKLMVQTTEILEAKNEKTTEDMLDPEINETLEKLSAAYKAEPSATADADTQACTNPRKMEEMGARIKAQEQIAEEFALSKEDKEGAELSETARAQLSRINQQLKRHNNFLEELFNGPYNLKLSFPELKKVVESIYGEIVFNKSSHFSIILPNTFRIWKTEKSHYKLERKDYVRTVSFYPHGRDHCNEHLSRYAFERCQEAFARAGITPERLNKLQAVTKVSPCK